MVNKHEIINNGAENLVDKKREEILSNYSNVLTKFAGNLTFVFDKDDNIDGVYIKGDNKIRPIEENVPEIEAIG